MLQVNFTDTVTSARFQTNLPINIPAFVGTNTAWVGLTGSEGGVLSHQIVSNFIYVPLPPLAASPSGVSNLTFTWPGAVAGFTLQSKTNLNATNWVSVPATITQVNGLNQAVIPSPTGTKFYRLVLP